MEPAIAGGPLREDCPDTHVRCVNLDQKLELGVRDGEYRSSGEAPLQCVGFHSKRRCGKVSAWRGAAIELKFLIK